MTLLIDLYILVSIAVLIGTGFLEGRLEGASRMAHFVHYVALACFWPAALIYYASAWLGATLFPPPTEETPVFGFHPPFSEFPPEEPVVDTSDDAIPLADLRSRQ